MNSFRRTISGLNNQHLFHKVDLIVFLEGGSTSYNKTEVEAGNYNEETDDIIFWKNIFTTFQNEKVKFKSIGSKTTIKEIAVDIINGKLTTVMVAMDNEFDEILNCRLKHKNIFYTYGYSWENDIWNDLVIRSVIEELSAVKIENNDIETNFKSFLSSIKTAVNADAYLFKKGGSFFPRKKSSLFCVECKPVDLPFIKKSDIDARILSKGISRKNVNAFGKRYNITSLKYCYGHLLADYCCQLVMHYLKKRHTLPGINKDFVYRMGINKFFNNHFDMSDIYSHYKAQFDRNVA